MKMTRLFLISTIIFLLIFSGCSKKAKKKEVQEAVVAPKIVTFQDIYNKLSPEEKAVFSEEQDSSRFYLSKSRVYENIGLQSESVKLLLSGADKMKYDYNKVSLLKEVGRIYQSMQSYEDAIKIYEKALDYDVDSYSRVDLLYSMGVIYNMKRDYKNAAKYYKKIVKEMGDAGDYSSLIRAMYGLAGIYSMQGNQKALINTYEVTIEKLKTIEQVKRNPIILSNIYMNLYNAYKQNEDWKNAKDALTKSIENIPPDRKDMYYWNLQRQMVELMTKSGDIEGAIKIYNELQQTQFENALSLITICKELGEKLEEAKRYGDAYNIYNATLNKIQTSGKDETAVEGEKNSLKFLIANNLLLQGKRDSGMKIYREIIETSKDTSKVTNAKFILAGIYEDANQKEDAKKMYEEVSQSSSYDLAFQSRKRVEKLSK